MVSIMYNFCLLQKKLKRQPFSSQPLFRRRIVVSSKACVNVEYIFRAGQYRSRRWQIREKCFAGGLYHGGVNNLACKNLFAMLNSKAKLKQSHVSLSLLKDNRKEEWLLLRARGTRWCSWICFVIRKYKLIQCPLRNSKLFTTGHT